MQFSDPQKNSKLLSLREGSVVADFGSGSGHYVFALAKAVGESGKVYAVDVQKDLLAKTQKEAKEKHVENIEIIWGNVEKLGGSKLKAESLDAVIVSNVLFQVEHKNTFVEECFRVLKSGGRILVIDWSESFGGLGPHKDNVVSEEIAETLFTQKGFLTQNTHMVGNHHYGLLFIKP